MHCLTGIIDLNQSETSSKMANYFYTQVCRDGECDPFLTYPNPEACVTTHFGVRTGHGADGHWHIKGTRMQSA